MFTNNKNVEAGILGYQAFADNFNCNFFLFLCQNPQGRWLEFFPWWGITGSMCNIGTTAAMTSAEGTRN